MEKNDFTIEDVKREATRDKEKKEHVKRIQIIVFKLGEEEYALPIDQIKEVVLTPRIALMPHTPPHIKGVANIRGNIIAIMDLGQRFNLEHNKDENSKKFNYTLVVESDEYKVGILVKEVPNTLTVNITDIDEYSNFIQYSASHENCIIGVVKHNERMIILIDMLKLMESESIGNNLEI